VVSLSSRLKLYACLDIHIVAISAKRSLKVVALKRLHLSGRSLDSLVYLDGGFSDLVS